MAPRIPLRPLLAIYASLALHPSGAPLSWFCAHKLLVLLFLLVINPIACLLGAIYLVATNSPGSSSSSDGADSAGGGLSAVAKRYRELLLAPAHWFATWRLNCVLVAWHAHVSGNQREYALEDKADFLLEADRLGLPVAPFVKAPKVFVKHRSIEGGQVRLCLRVCMGVCVCVCVRMHTRARLRVRMCECVHACVRGGVVCVCVWHEFLDEATCNCVSVHACVSLIWTLSILIVCTCAWWIATMKMLAGTPCGAMLRASTSTRTSQLVATGSCRRLWRMHHAWHACCHEEHLYQPSGIQ